ncbi:hypothetical protein D4764_01G0004710 [Takifugu flavidus]|uniref:Uncharacterized protein n=1 Tax=Takifugu flavidus TaxID=433684 RepID=A0A5C6PP72_9TELE|nr:hypothetical protein D4764_01G0004710 [Takifugu flavidus]
MEDHSGMLRTCRRPLPGCDLQRTRAGRSPGDESGRQLQPQSGGKAEHTNSNLEFGIIHFRSLPSPAFYICGF